MNNFTEVNGAVTEDREALIRSFLGDIFGSQYNPFGYESLGDYNFFLASLTPYELQEHANKIGLAAIPEINELRARCINEFEKYLCEKSAASIQRHYQPPSTLGDNFQELECYKVARG